MSRVARRANKISANATTQVTTMELVMKNSSRKSGSAFCGMPCSAASAWAGWAAAVPSKVLMTSARSGDPAAARKNAGAAIKINAASNDFINIGTDSGDTRTAIPALKINVFGESAGKIAVS